MTFYTWTSDQFSLYGGKTIVSTVRDATYVLDEILANETELPILEHTTDTSGYTEIVFALFDLLGLTFTPRIKDLADQQLYRTENVDLSDLPQVRARLSKRVNTKLILEMWDEMLHLVGSLNLLANADILWNSVYMTVALEQLEREEYVIDPEALMHIWPTRFEHINVYGKYEFNLEEARHRTGLRDLRRPDALDP